MKDQTKFDIYLDHTYSPVKIYDRLYPFSEVLAIRRPDLYAQLYFKFVSNLALASSDEEYTPPETPPNSPVTARPSTRF